MYDLEKRKRIIERSLNLGHCICNPKQPCPCEMLQEKNICMCAGERPEDIPDTVPLTQFVENAGCASKINQNDLKKALAGLPALADPRVLVSADTCDDAGIFKLSDDLALVQSVDIFTPGVDDPYIFGQIAAANSVSDIYAMGGTPLSALSIIGFPIETMSHKIMHQILRGGIDKLQEAGVAVIGGHSIKDNEVKFGFAVTGVIHPEKIITNDQAEPGDMLILTKPLGTGVIGFASQVRKATESAAATAAQAMTELNKVPSEIMRELGVTTATDVTGFALLGHLSEMVLQSGVTAEVHVDKVPLFEGVLDYIKEGVISGAIERNREYASQYVELEGSIPEEMIEVLYDPQTSGGLLMAVKPEIAPELISRLRARSFQEAAVIGVVISRSDGKIILKHQQ